MRTILVVALALSMSTPAFAGRVQKRQVTQRERIEQGVRTGELTKREAAKLKAKEAKLKREIRLDRVDGGGLSPAERAKIEKKQDELSREIAREKHDVQKARR